MEDAVIIGAGVIGCSIALALSRRGWRTLNVDRLPAAGYGSTSFSSAIIRPYYSSVEGTALAWESHFHWQDWRAFVAAPDADAVARYIECGCIITKNAENNYLAQMQKVLDTVGVPYEELDAAGLQRRLPGADASAFAPVRRIDDPTFGVSEVGPIAGALFIPGGYVNDPQLAARNLQAAAEALGGRFLFKATVAEIRRENNAVRGVTLADGTRIDARIVINAGGPASTAINRLAGEDVLAGMTVTTRALRNEVAHVPAPAAFSDGNGCVITDTDIGVYLRPETGNHVMIGSLEPPCDPLEWVDPDDISEAFTDQWTNQVWRAAQRFPDLEIPNSAQGVVALYDVSSDWIPIYDRSDLDGYFMAIGTSGNQFKNAPMAGELMAALVDHVSSGGDHDAQPLSFTLPTLKWAINLGFFSRRRSVSAETTNTVLG